MREHRDERQSLRPKCQWGGKTMYESERAAKIARNTVGKSGHNVNEMRIYQCPNCYKYHFTSRKN